MSKVPLFGVFLVRMRENADQQNYECGHFSCREYPKLLWVLEIKPVVKAFELSTKNSKSKNANKDRKRLKLQNFTAGWYLPTMVRSYPARQTYFLYYLTVLCCGSNVLMSIMRFSSYNESSRKCTDRNISLLFRNMRGIWYNYQISE